MENQTNTPKKCLKKGSKSVIAVRFSAALTEKIDLFATKKGCTTTEAVRRIVADWLKNPKNLHKIKDSGEVFF